MEFTRPGSENAQLGLAPLLDVVLLLLIFFVVTTSFNEPSLDLDLPAAESSEVGAASGIVVSLSAEGRLAVAGEPVSIDELEARLGDAARQDSQLELRADRAARHGDVVELLDRARRAGVTRIGIAVASGGAAPRED